MTEVPTVTDLPYELQFEILLRLPFEEVVGYCQLNLAAAEVCRSPVFWNLKARQDFGSRANPYPITGTNPVAQYLWIRSQLPRPEGRAKVHHLFLGEDEDFTEWALHELRRQRADLRRGDFVLNDAETGYRNQGKYIFDGQRIRDLEDYPDDYGSIPEEFQAGDFPPMYWVDILDHNTYIPFNVRRNLGTLDPRFVQLLKRADGRGSHIVYPFIGFDGRYYGIVDAESRRPTEERLRQFLEEIQDQTHFNFYRPDNFPSSGRIPLPPGISYDQLLFHFNE